MTDAAPPQPVRPSERFERRTSADQPSITSALIALSRSGRRISGTTRLGARRTRAASPAFRSSRVRFYKAKPVEVEEYSDQWGGIDDLSPTDDTTEVTAAATWEKPTTEWLRYQEQQRRSPRIQYDQQTWDLINAGHATSLAPPDCGLTV
jgi:hypothetical protein